MRRTDFEAVQNYFSQVGLHYGNEAAGEWMERVEKMPADEDFDPEELAWSSYCSVNEADISEAIDRSKLQFSNSVRLK